jgi:NAD(P)H-flavin reductase
MKEFDYLLDLKPNDIAIAWSPLMTYKTINALLARIQYLEDIEKEYNELINIRVKDADINSKLLVDAALAGSGNKPLFFK